VLVYFLSIVIEFFGQFPIQLHLHHYKRTVCLSLHILSQALRLTLSLCEQQIKPSTKSYEIVCCRAQYEISQRLSGIAEYFQADNAVLRKENGELKEFLNKRTERQSGKRVILKGKFVITTEQIYKDLADAERKTKLSKKKRKRSRAVSEEEELELLEVFDVVENKEREIQDCIAVQQS